MPSLVQKRRQAVYKAPSEAFAELGVTGLRQYGGFVAEEWLRQLAGQGRAARVWREMADNDATVGALLFAVKMLARGVEWTVEEGADPAAAEFVEECMDDISGTWEDFISEVMTMLQYGWELSEIVYKKRQGPEPRGKGPDGRPLPTSKFNDGKIGWRKLPMRPAASKGWSNYRPPAGCGPSRWRRRCCSAPRRPRAIPKAAPCSATPTSRGTARRRSKRSRRSGSSATSRVSRR
jgi:hypothetical protein